MAGTPVHTPAGTIAIDALSVAALICATISPIGTPCAHPIAHTGLSGYAIQVVDVTANGETMRSTIDHPYWTRDRGWIQAGDLRRGDELVTIDGFAVLVQDVCASWLPEPVPVFAVEPQDGAAFFVGSSGFLVHSVCSRYVIQKDDEFVTEVSLGAMNRRTRPRAAGQR